MKSLRLHLDKDVFEQFRWALLRLKSAEELRLITVIVTDSAAIDIDSRIGEAEGRLNLTSQTITFLERTVCALSM
ncbi:hypothetical protein AAVH_19666 [Aphelenchoides avenae]|nr:hypothetical protein AAVH_19666 [Aphelenchus avenae]